MKSAQLARLAGLHAKYVSSIAHRLPGVSFTPGGQAIFDPKHPALRAWITASQKKAKKRRQRQLSGVWLRRPPKPSRASPAGMRIGIPTIHRVAMEFNLFEKRVDIDRYGVAECTLALELLTPILAWAEKVRARLEKVEK